MPFQQSPLKIPELPPEPDSKTNSGAMARLAEAALSVPADELRDYLPTETDILIAQGMLQGNISVPELAKSSGVGTESVRLRLQNPVGMAWICQQVSRLIHTRIGIVDAALLRKACQGDARAIEVFYKRFGRLAEIKIVAHGTFGDLSRYSDADVDALIASEIARDPALPRSSVSQSSSSEIVDVTPESAS